MPFAFQYLARSSSSGNTDAGKQWIYNGTATFGSDETLATIVATGYFNAAQSTLTPFTIAGATGSTGPLAVGDILDIRGTDANGQYYVTSVTTNVTLAVWNATSGVTYSGSPAVVGDLASFGDTSGDIVDSGVAATNLVLLTPAGNQVITADSLEVAQGNVQAGSSGHAGTLISFPGTSAKGSLIIAGVANTGNTNTTISNDAMGQASVVSIPDPANANAQFLIGATTTPFATGNIPVASGTGGLMADSGLSSTSTTANVLGVFTATVTLSATQVNASYAAPTLVLAAPGAGKAIVPTRVLMYTNVSTAFAAGGVAQIQWANTVHGGGTAVTSATFPAAEVTAAASQLYSLGSNVGAALTGITNEALYFSNATQAFTTGTGSTLTFVIEYIVVTATV